MPRRPRNSRPGSAQGCPNPARWPCGAFRTRRAATDSYAEHSALFVDARAHGYALAGLRRLPERHRKHLHAIYPAGRLALVELAIAGRILHGDGIGRAPGQDRVRPVAHFLVQQRRFERVQAGRHVAKALAVLNEWQFTAQALECSLENVDAPAVERDRGHVPFVAELAQSERNRVVIDRGAGRGREVSLLRPYIVRRAVAVRALLDAVERREKFA